ncbi:putative mitochondrial protein [Tanacetum coccineum]
MMAAFILKLPNFEKDFMVEIDASREGIGALLQQQGHLVTYLSKALSPKHQLLSTYEKEFLAMLQALDKWRGGKNNDDVDALSRVQGSAQLLHMLVSIISSDVQQRIMESWTDDMEIQALMEKLKTGNDIGLQHDLIEYFHAGTMGKHSGVKVTTHSMCAMSYWKKIRKHIKQCVNECSVCQLNKVNLDASPGFLQPLPIP